MKTTISLMNKFFDLKIEGNINLIYPFGSDWGLACEGCPCLAYERGSQVGTVWHGKAEPKTLEIKSAISEFVKLCQR
jgi:hypothetical protein